MVIIICGLNGAGKSTLGKVLAEKLKFHFIDIEDLYFTKTDPDYIFASPRTREEVERLLLCEMETHENLILASVKGDYGEDIYSFFSVLYCLMLQKILDCNELKSVLFRSSVVECY